MQDICIDSFFLISPLPLGIRVVHSSLLPFTGEMPELSNTGMPLLTAFCFYSLFTSHTFRTLSAVSIGFQCFPTCKTWSFRRYPPQFRVRSVQKFCTEVIYIDCLKVIISNNTKCPKQILNFKIKKTLESIGGMKVVMGIYLFTKFI